MSLHNLARQVQQKGRGRDTTLVHMSPRELQGLQALAKAHGGSLTINPQTGLAEAGFLEQVLPVVAAAAATYFTAGAAAPAIAGALGSAGMGAAAAGTAGGILAGAGSGALISGGMAAAQGKDAGKAALMGGLGGAVAGGMGAYGDATTFASDAAQKSAIEGVAQGSGTAATGAPAGFTPPTTPVIPPTAAGNAAAALPEGAARNAALEQLATGQGVHAEGFAGLPGQGLSAAPGIGTPPPSISPSYYTNLAPDSYIQKAGIQALPAAGLLEDGKPAPTTPEEESRLKRISPNFRAQDPVQPNPYYRAQYPSFASGGLADLGGYSDGGRLLRGPGDGMSDSIPAKIGTKQPARLADGEFVIPADVVSHLGNGSTDAGAKQLYAMMAKIRSARTGKKKQAPAVNTRKFLPA
jgi:hypothetical protein